ncbi:hypothetical protein ACF07T_41785 [Streptomyces sp. NPDC015184]|uniref:hypothetical protein n=1 Tax=Streptomyces sp. NPDC015184 TaxID=3364946 RepID=UPI0036F775D2
MTLHERAQQRCLLEGPAFSGTGCDESSRCSSQWDLIGSQAEAGEKVVLAGGESVPGGELTVQPAVGLHAVDYRVAAQRGWGVVGFGIRAKVLA